MKPRTQKSTQKKLLPRWVREDDMDAAHLAGLISHSDYSLAKQWISEMREGRHPESKYGIPEYTLQATPEGRMLREPTNKTSLATFAATYAPGGSLFWQNISYAMGILINPGYKAPNATILQRMEYLRAVGVIKQHTYDFIVKTFEELEQGAYFEALYTPGKELLRESFRWHCVPGGDLFWRYIDFIDEKLNA